MLECCGVVRTVPVVANEAEIFLDFHVYDNLDITILIGRPTEILFQEMANGSLAVQLGKSTQTVSLAHAWNAIAEPSPVPYPFENLMGVTLSDMAQPNLGDDAIYFSQQEEVLAQPI
jgi:hypothetical protein